MIMAGVTGHWSSGLDGQLAVQAIVSDKDKRCCQLGSRRGPHGLSTWSLGGSRRGCSWLSWAVGGIYRFRIERPVSDLCRVESSPVESIESR